VAAANFLAVVEDFRAVVADLVAAAAADFVAAADSAAAAADSLAPAVGVGDEARREFRRRRQAAARRKVQTRSTRSLHRCPRLSLEAASGRSPTSSSSPWMCV
jgi:hypothetical protein